MRMRGEYYSISVREQATLRKLGFLPCEPLDTQHAFSLAVALGTESTRLYAKYAGSAEQDQYEIETKGDLAKILAYRILNHLTREHRQAYERIMCGDEDDMAFYDETTGQLE